MRNEFVININRILIISGMFKFMITRIINPYLKGSASQRTNPDHLINRLELSSLFTTKNNLIRKILLFFFINT